jgi:hypothetical protein
VHDVYVADVSEHTLAALRDLRRPYTDNIVTRRFSVDVRRPDEYLSTVHCMMARWAAIVSSRLEPAAVTAQERCGEMSPAELTRYRRRTRKQPLQRYAPYRIARPRKVVAAGLKATGGAGARLTKVACRR